MIGYLLKILGVLLVSFCVIFFYYNIEWAPHTTNFDGYLWYFFPLLVCYWIYKFIQLEKSDKIAEFSIWGLVGLFLIQLFIMCMFYFIHMNLWISWGLILFWKIIGYSLLPLLIGLVSIVFGNSLLKILLSVKNEHSSTFNSILGFVLGFTFFISSIVILWLLGFYNLEIIISILGLMMVVSYQSILELYKSLFTKTISYDIEEGNYLKLLSTEFLFVVASIVGAMVLINIVRPFPIGWDDLWVYMNFPKLLAQSWEIISLWGMYSWQTFTWIGYLFSSATQAFFLNAFGGFASFIILLKIFKDLFKSEKKSFFNIPLLLAVMFISMPMIVFEQAKDMKLDPGLFFISISALYLFVNYLLQKNKLAKDNIIILLIIGWILGLSFTIKFTSLLLIIGVLALLFFNRIGVLWLIGYLLCFVAIFTKFGLWKKMNVVFPSDDLTLVNLVFYTGITTGGMFFLYTFIKYKKYFLRAFKELLLIVTGLILVVSPWFTSHILESQPKVNMSVLLSGETEYFRADFTEIKTQKEIDTIKEEKILERKTENGTTANEDFGRYFGYWEGITNYINLPWNLTMQMNQKGEFTDIGYIFLALLPSILLFLPYRKKHFNVIVPGLILFEILVFLGVLSPIFISQWVPLGYITLIIMTIIPVTLILNSLEYYKWEDKINQKIETLRLLLIFTSIYVFLWMIAAYGVVWYGIVMYFSFLAFIGYWLYYATWYNENDSEKEYSARWFGSLVLFLIFLIFIVQSVIPAAFSNVKNAWLIEYKRGDFNATEALFRYHPDYLNTLYNLNISEDKRDIFLKSILPNSVISQIPNLSQIPVLNLARYLNTLALSGTQDSPEAKVWLDNLYAKIINPEDSYKNNNIIYRAGTFLKYHISENNKRLLEDSLLFQFNDYIYDENIDITIENFKKLWISYLLVDLNAATIDQSETHELTKRYEKILRTFQSNDLELIETDSICLQLALEENKNQPNEIEFMQVAGVNYESYDKDDNVIPRGEKALVCYKKILEIIENEKVTNENYSYLIPIVKAIQSNPKLKDWKTLINYIHEQYKRSAKVLFKIK